MTKRITPNPRLNRTREERIAMLERANFPPRPTAEIYDRGRASKAKACVMRH